MKMEELLVIRQPNSRRKATYVASQEAIHLLQHLGADIISGGPFGDPMGLFYLKLPSENLEPACRLLPHLGYSEIVEQVVIVSDDLIRNKNELSRWKGKYYRLEKLYQADTKAIRDMSPDRREFLLPTEDGGVRHVVGYRGDGGLLSRRGLPVIDSRMLVNLVYNPKLERFLDPFAGAGGLVVEAVAHNFETYSTDIDPKVRFGLQFLGAKHTVADARQLPFPSCYFHSIASEPPYEEVATDTICESLLELDRVLHLDGRVALLIAESQYIKISECAKNIGWQIELDHPINRKGLPVNVLSWRKTANPV
ncbi:hypothetical protein [Microcoleus sp. T2B6]|uniref:hypothetical protein n=1 Tax=Microcoleus sp. T2B6 TaxID=3055424 RepID=UPI002FD78BF1